MDVVAGRKAFPSTSSSVQQLTAVVHRKYISTSSVLYDFPLLSHVVLLLLTELSSRNEEKKTQIYFSQFLFGLRLFRLYDCALVSILLRFSQLSPLFMCPSVKYWFGILYIYRYDAQQLYIESQSHYAPSGREYRMVIGRLHGWSLLHNLFPISFVRFSFVSFSIFYSILLFLWCYSTDLLIASLGVTKRTQPYI